MQALWQRFFQRLVALAENKLRWVPRRAADGEDVALSALDRFFRAAQSGRFPQLGDRHDLWTVLVLIVDRKACDLIEHEQRQRRDWRRTQQKPGTASGQPASDDHLLRSIISQEPDPGFAVEMV